MRDECLGRRRPTRPDSLLLSNGIKPAIAQLVEHLTVDLCSDQMVPDSIPGGRTLSFIPGVLRQRRAGLLRLTSARQRIEVRIPPRPVWNDDAAWHAEIAMTPQAPAHRLLQVITMSVCPSGQGGGLKIHCTQVRVGSNPTADI